jgi:lipopolysaccharide/colanic/teichoic acid biosynthesis glycosyltransferase
LGESRSPSLPLSGSPATAGFARRPVYAALKRSLDLLASGVGLLLVSPVLAVAAIAVRLDSPGPAIFPQRRVGRNFRPFWIYKFRTMVVDAQQRGAQITAGADPRITRVGRWLRKTKIDELPQLFNVLLGDMSLVGPRPEVPKYVEMFRDDYAVILSVRPGLTDPASIKYRDEAAILADSADPQQEYVGRILPDKIALARDYIARATLASDLAVVARTLLRITR